MHFECIIAMNLGRGTSPFLSAYAGEATLESSTNS